MTTKKPYEPITVNQAGDMIVNTNQDRSVDPGTAEDDPRSQITLRAIVRVSLAQAGQEPTREKEDEIISIIVNGVPPKSERAPGVIVHNEIGPDEVKDDPRRQGR